MKKQENNCDHKTVCTSYKAADNKSISVERKNN